MSQPAQKNPSRNPVIYADGAEAQKGFLEAMKAIVKAKPKKKRA